MKAMLTLLGISLILMVLSVIDLLIEPSTGQAIDWSMLHQVRAPRVLGAWAAGACLGLAGALAQSLFRNPLADPFLIGSASGAQLGAVISLVILGSIRIEVSFCFALAAVLLAHSIAGRRERILVAGFVVSILLGALVSFLNLRFPETLRSTQSFMLGQTQLLDWPQAIGLSLIGLIALGLACFLARQLQALSLGEMQAQAMGIAVGRSTALVNMLIAALSAVTVAYCGMLAFVGLGAPHIARKLFHTQTLDRPKLFFAAASLIGGALLIASDLIARLLFWPSELPVGIVTACLGGIYLLTLLRQSRA